MTKQHIKSTKRKSPQSAEKSLRALVELTLKEDDDNGLVGAGMDMNPYGANYTTRDMMYKAFVKPFVNVVDVAAGKTKEVSQAAQTAFKAAGTALATSIVPGLKSNYDKIFTDASKKMDKIRQEYADIYAVTWDAFKDNDIVTAAFMLDPAAVLSSAVAMKSANTTAKILSVISGGQLDNFLGKLGDRFGARGKHKSNDRTAGSAFNTWYGESVVHEADESEEKSKKPIDYLTNPKVIRKAVSSPEAQHMQVAAKGLIGQLLSSIVDQAKILNSCNSLKEIQAKLKIQLPALQEFSKLDQNQRAEAERSILANTKKSMKEFYIKNLEDTAQGVVKAGIPKNSKFIEAVSEAINQIKAL